MKFTCTKEHLDRALRYSAKATTKHHTLPIVQNIHLIAQDGVLTCVATNLDVGVAIHIAGHIEEEGEIVVPPNLLQSFVSSTDAGAKISATVEQGKTLLVLRSGTSMVSIKGFGADDFPPIPSQKQVAQTASFDAMQFKDGISRTMVGVAQTEARPELTGINMIFAQNQLRAAATDGFRLSENIIPITAWEHLGDQYPTVIVPSSAIAEVLYVVGDANEKELRISMENSQVFFTIGDVVIVSRIITGTYPDYQQIIPQNPTATITVDRTAMEQAVRLAGAFTSRTTNDMRMHIDSQSGLCTIYSASQDSGENETTVAINGDGEVQDVFLNVQYVLDGVTRCGTTTVQMAFSGPSSPVVITPVDDSQNRQFLYLVMPIRK